MINLNNFFKEINRLLTRIPVRRLERSTTGIMWEKAQDHLTEYNKTVITLSSSALILSFSIVKIGNVQTNKLLLGFSWGLFLLAIGIGIFMLLLTFFYSLSAANLERLNAEKGYKFEDHMEKPEVLFFWRARSIMIWLSISELVLFFAALISLIITAFISI